MARHDAASREEKRAGEGRIHASECRPVLEKSKRPSAVGARGKGRGAHLFFSSSAQSSAIQAASSMWEASSSFRDERNGNEDDEDDDDDDDNDDDDVLRVSSLVDFCNRFAFFDAANLASWLIFFFGFFSAEEGEDGEEGEEGEEREGEEEAREGEEAPSSGDWERLGWSGSRRRVLRVVFVERRTGRSAAGAERGREGWLPRRSRRVSAVLYASIRCSAPHASAARPLCDRSSVISRTWPAE